MPLEEDIGDEYLVGMHVKIIKSNSRSTNIFFSYAALQKLPTAIEEAEKVNEIDADLIKNRKRKSGIFIGLSEIKDAMFKKIAKNVDL